MIEVLSHPRTTTGIGRDTVIYTKTPSISSSEVEDVLMKLQNTYRTYQAQLNALKHEIETEIQQDEIKKKVEFEQSYDEYKKEHSEFVNERKLRMAKFEILRAKELQSIYALKIVIPESLNSVYKELSRIGKKLDM